MTETEKRKSDIKLNMKFLQNAIDLLSGDLTYDNRAKARGILESLLWCEDRRSKRQVWTNENDLAHREDGPAIITADGTKYWCRNGRTHREDGPAIERSNGHNRWVVCGIPFSEEDIRSGMVTVGKHKITIERFKLITDAKRAE